MFNAQGLFADAGEGEKLEDCGGVGDAQGRSFNRNQYFQSKE